MYYFFDESGNWEEIDKEKRKLVIAGMVVKDQKTVLQLRDKVKKFKQQYNIKEIHATTLRSNNQQDALGRLYEMIYTFIQQGHIKVLAYVVQPSSLKTTRKSNEEIYIDFASDIISEICFGDRDIDIDYDMKFRYAYPKNIIDHINTNTIKQNRDFKNILEFLTVNADKDKQQRLLNIYRNKITSISNYANISKINIKEYMLTELYLNIKSDKTREILRNRIQNLIEKRSQKYNAKYTPNVRIKYKYKESSGVELIEVIDTINNLIIGINANKNNKIAKKIYENIAIKESK